MIRSSHRHVSFAHVFALLAPSSQNSADEDNDSGYADGSEQEPCTAYQKCGPSEQVRQLDRLKAGRLLGLDSQETDVAATGSHRAASSAMAFELIERT